MRGTAAMMAPGGEETVPEGRVKPGSGAGARGGRPAGGDAQDPGARRGSMVIRLCAVPAARWGRGVMHGPSEFLIALVAIATAVTRLRLSFVYPDTPLPDLGSALPECKTEEFRSAQ